MKHPLLSALTVSTLATLAFAVPRTAGADVPPPPGYKEQCTVALACKADEVGDSCSAWHGERDKCEKLYSGTAFTHRCSTRGASTWTEVWCAPKGTPVPSPIPVKPAEPK